VHYKLKNNETVIDLAIADKADGQFTAIIGDKRVAVGCRRIGDYRLLLAVDGRQTSAWVADTPEGKAVMVAGRTWLLEAADTRGPRSRSGPKTGPKAVTAPMPAVVTKILVQPGHTVEKGQALIVVSAMKMDTTLTAPYAGVVKAVNVAEGDKVTPKQVLVDIDAA